MNVPNMFDDIHSDGCPGLYGDPCTCTNSATRQSAARIFRAFYGDFPEASLHDYERAVLERIRARMREH